ncbi:MAG: (2Fe-2S)-binding protein [Sinorhizobium meliloti]|nr:(2Fe-2S)-binding protein [Sinorhizobium meliloti]
MVSLTVNGSPHQIEADPATPLLYVLRNELALNGAKYGCGLGQCGSCTVVVDGEAVLSCMVPIMLLEGREITTIEGLGTIDAPGPLQEAFIELQAAQCGYCIPGMMMSAHALLRRNAQPSDEDIREALATNLCRCGTHIRILTAIRRAGELMQAASLPATDQGRAG